MRRVVKKKRVLRMERVSMAILVCAVLMSMLSSVFLRAYNNELAMDIQQIENEIMSIQAENEIYEVAVQNLSNKDRVMDIAEMEGLALNQSRVITVSKTE